MVDYFAGIRAHALIPAFLLLSFLFAALQYNEGGCAQQEDTANGVCPGAVTTGLGQNKALVVHHGKRHDGIITGHSCVFAVDGSRGGQQLCAAGLAGIVIGGGNHHGYIVTQQDIATIRSGLSQLVGIGLQALYQNVCIGVRSKDGSVVLFGGESGHIVNAALVLSQNIDLIGGVIHTELDLGESAGIVGKLLG